MWDKIKKFLKGAAKFVGGVVIGGGVCAACLMPFYGLTGALVLVAEGIATFSGVILGFLVFQLITRSMTEKAMEKQLAS